MATNEMSAVQTSLQDRLVRFGPIAAGVLAVIVLYWDALVNMWQRWGEQQELSHSYFIPLISAWLIWENRRAISKSVGAPSAIGLVGIAIAGFMLLLGKITHIFLLQQLGFVVAIAGLTAGLGGLSLLRITAAPIAFLLFAVPPPYWVITVLSWNFQQWSSEIGVLMIKAMDIPVYLSGNIIDLGHYKLQVVEACSGLRYLFPFLSIGVMTAYLFRGPLWGKAVIVLSTIPITIVFNSFRIAVTGALVQAYGAEHAEGALHFFEGWVVFLLCLIALFAVVWALTFFMKPRPAPLESIGSPDLKPVTPSTGMPWSRNIVGGALIAAALGFYGLLQVATTDSLIIPERRSFASLPYEFEGWRHEVRPIDPSVAEVLGADDTIVVNFRTPEEETYNLYIAYLEAQRDGRSWHSPRQCIPGGGWQIQEHTILSDETALGAPRNYNRLLITNRNHRQLVYYWYDQRNRKIANEFVMKFWLMFDAIFKQRSDGSMVRVMTAIRDGESVADADARLQGMMTQLDPVLLKAIAEFLQGAIPEDVDMLAGLEMGGIPIATMLGQLSGLPVLFVRKEAKTYGTCKLAEGGDIEGKKLLIVEDVVTSGGAILDGVKQLRERGAEVTDVVCVIDREGSGVENLNEVGLTLQALFTRSELEASGD